AAAADSQRGQLPQSPCRGAESPTSLGSAAAVHGHALHGDRAEARSGRIMDTPGRPVSRRGAILSGVSLISAGFGIGGKLARAAPPARSAGLTPQQFAGQRVISCYSGLTPPSSLLQQISAGETSG